MSLLIKGIYRHQKTLMAGLKSKDLGYFFIICPETKTMYCKQCGKFIDDDSNFCAFCGTKIFNDKTSITEERKPFIPQNYITNSSNVSVKKVSKYDETFYKSKSFKVLDSMGNEIKNNLPYPIHCTNG